MYLTTRIVRSYLVNNTRQYHIHYHNWGLEDIDVFCVSICSIFRVRNIKSKWLMIESEILTILTLAILTNNRQKPGKELIDLDNQAKVVVIFCNVLGCKWSNPRLCKTWLHLLLPLMYMYLWTLTFTDMKGGWVSYLCVALWSAANRLCVCV